MTAREYLNTKMYWTQDDVPVKTVTPEDIIEWLEGYAEVVKNNAVLPHVSCPLCGRYNGVTQKMLDAEYYVRAYINEHNKPPTYRNVAKQFNIAVCASHARLRHCRELMRARDNGS